MPVPTLSAQSPSVGRISWPAFSIQYGGVAYSVAAYNTDKKFTWWKYNGGAPTLNFSNQLPDGLLHENALPNATFGLEDSETLTGASWWGHGWSHDGGYNPVGTVTSYGQRVESVNRPGNWAMKLTTTAAAPFGTGSASFGLNGLMTVAPGDTVSFQAEITNATATNVGGVYIRWFDQAGSQYTNVAEGMTVPNGTSGTYIQQTFTVPAGVTGIRPFILLYSGSAGADKTIYVESFKVSREAIQPAIGPDDLLLFLNKNGVPASAQRTAVMDGSLIVSESIYADAIAANQVTAEHILAGAIDATHVRAGAIQTNHIASGAVTAEQIDVNVLRAGFTITGAIQVGTHTWTPNEGFIIPGVVTLPGLAGGIATFSGQITATRLTVQKDLTLMGNTNKIAGTLTLADGITRPTTTPSAFQSWDFVGSRDMSFGPIHYGLCAHLSDSTVLLQAESFYGGAIVQIYKANNVGWVPAANGAQYGSGFTSTYKAYMDNFAPTGGITSFSGAYYILGQDNNRSGIWYIYKLDASFNKVAEVYVAPSTWAPGGRPCVGNDGTSVLLTFGMAPNTIRTHFYNTSLVYSTYSDYTFTNIQHTPISFTGIGDFGIGGTRHILAAEGITNFACTTAGAREGDAYAFAPAGGHTVRGLWYDGTRFWSMGSNGSLYKHGTNATTQAITVSHTYYDGNAGGTGPHQTEETTSPGSFTRGQRTFLNVTTEEAPDSGVTDAGQADKANRVGVYVGVNGAARRLQILNDVDGSGRSIKESRFDVINTGSTTPPATNGFVGAQNSPGILKTAAATSSQGVILNGDGSGALSGITWDKFGAFTSVKHPMTDTGWIPVNGTNGMTFFTGWGLWGDAGNEAPAHRRIGNTVKVRGLFKRNTGTEAGMLLLPVGCRPSKVAWRTMLSNGNPNTCYVNSAGAIVYFGPIAYTNGQWVNIDLSFDLD